MAQQTDSWTAFYNADTTLIGFKDKAGTVKITPKFMGFISAKRFDDIIGVTEQAGNKWSSYYLTKSGRVIGQDSLHIFDNGVDCENEGFIRFRDKQTDQAGMFNSKGDIAVPAVYNDLSRTRNGLIVGLKGAKKESISKDPVDPHFGWTGGKHVLLNTNNEELISNFETEGRLDFYSLKIADKPDPDPVRESFKAVDGRYYSFVNFDKAFRSWLKQALPAQFNKTDLLKASYKEITFWKEPTGWISENKNSFIHRNFELIRKQLLEIYKPGADYHIFDEALNPMIYESEDYKPFFNNCGEAKNWLYPAMNIVINHKGKKDIYQDQITFLKTPEGYRLISFVSGTTAVK